MVQDHLSFILVTALSIFTLLYSGCSRAGSESDSAQVPAILDKKWQEFIAAWENEDAVSCAALYHTGALNVPNAMTVNNGRESIESFYSSLFEANQSSRYNHQTESISFSDNLAVEYANFSVDWVSNEGEEWTYQARALIHWRKDNNGDWLIQHFAFNQAEPVTSQVSES
jgi:uncharacterized protein (TIGR02246 family)